MFFDSLSINLKSPLYFRSLSIGSSTCITFISWSPRFYSVSITSLRTLLVLISDFLVDISEVIEEQYNLGEHEIKVIQVLDPIERDLKYSGDFKLIDSESKSMLRTYISPRLRVEYQQMLDNHVAKMEDTCNNLGYHFHQITTNTPIFDAFYRVLK